MINENAILEYIKKQGKSCSSAQITKSINEVNREELTEVEKKRFKYEIWDKKMSINGIEPNVIIKSRDYAIGQAYIIYIDDVLVYFQDHNPNKEGFVKMTKSEATKIAEEFIEKKIEESVDSIIVQKVINEILSK